MQKVFCNKNLLIALFLTGFLLLSSQFAFPQEKTNKKDLSLSQGYSWYKGEREMQIYLALDEVALFPDSFLKLTAADIETAVQNVNPDARIIESNDFVVYLKLPQKSNKTRLEEIISTFEEDPIFIKGCPVFYTSQRKSPGSRMSLTGEIIVHFPSDWGENKIKSWANEWGLDPIMNFSFAREIYLFSGPEGLESLELANEIYLSGEVVYAYPNWLKTMSTRAIPDDTLFNDQWHLQNTGQGGGTAGEDVNITGVWDTYRGTTDEVIAIVDDGLEIGHEDLSTNILSGYSWDYVGGDSDPTGGYHGTCVGGVAAARGFNSLGVCGAAPWSALVGLRLLGAGTDANEADALTRSNQTLDIYSNSWGPADDGARLEGPGPLAEAALLEGITNGRGGLGSIYVWAGGNGYESDDNANYDGYANSRYTIAVASSTNYGDHAYYSEAGANILVNTPSRGGSLGITTTDRTGSNGYSSGNYYNNFGGTSASAPLASGIIALVLEANPNLTWRDIQQILATTAEQNDPTDSDWTTNGAGYPINHKYGFGRVNAQATITAAEAWTNVGPEVSAEGSSTPNISIPDNDSTGVSDTITISNDFSIEYVEVYFSAADHTYWGDLQVELTSPEGTTSILAEGQHSVSTSYSYDNWRFGSARHLGESTQGSWTLTVKDLWAGDTGTFQSWILKIYGEDKSAYVVNMIEMPWYETIASYYSTGAAVSQMILNYIREGAGEPLLTQDEIYEYARDPLSADGTELDANQVDKALGHFDPYDYLVSNAHDIYDSLPDGNSLQGYNYAVDTYPDTDITEYMRDVCHWMDYDVTEEEWWKEPQVLVAHPKTPAAVPIFGDTQGYDHWVAVKGFAVSEDPCPTPHTNPWNSPDFTVYGFWMKDPQISGIGMNTYKTAAECEATYFKPLATGDAYDGKLLQVAEPPAEMSNAYVEIQEPNPDLANLEFIGVDVDIETISRYSSTDAVGYGKKESFLKKESWRDLVDSYLLTDSEAVAAFEDTQMGTPILIRHIDKGRNYYLVPFRKQGKRGWRRGWRNFTATGVIILDAQEGYFREASWTEFPDKFLPIKEQEAEKILVNELMRDIEQSSFFSRHRQSWRRYFQNQVNHTAELELVWSPEKSYSDSPYQPYWRISFDNQFWFVTQDGEIYKERN